MAQLKLKRFVKDFLPPIVLGLYRTWQNEGVSYTGNYCAWQDAVANSSGYDADLILERVSSALLKVKSGDAVYERDSVLFDRIEHSYPLLAGLLRAAAGNEGKLTILDFGGSLGSTYFQCRKFLSVLPQLNWCVVEQEKFVWRGRELFETEQLRFFFSVQECMKVLHPNVMLFSAVLQYLQDPFALLKAAMQTEVEYIIVDRTQFSGLNRDWLSVQYVPPEIYSASYPCWIFSESHFKQSLAKQFELVAEFDALGGSGRVVSGVAFTYKGMIWRRR